MAFIVSLTTVSHWRYTCISLSLPSFSSYDKSLKKCFLISLISLLLPISATVNQVPEEGLWTCSDWRTDRLVSARKHGGSSYAQWNPSTLPRESPHRILHALRHDQFQSKKGRGITLCTLPCKILSHHFFVYFASSESNIIVIFSVVLSKSSPGFLKLLQSSSLDICWFFAHC